MQLTKAQDDILRDVFRWVKESKTQVKILGGYAGTGKTTLIQSIVRDSILPPICCAPTGKAASVLQSKLPDQFVVSTVHSILYTPLTPPEDNLMMLEDALTRDPENQSIQDALAAERRLLANKELRFSLKYKILSPNDLIIVDECSMVSKQMQEDLIATGAKILFVGDPGQLPPVKSKGFFELHHADFLLTEVHRQAVENPIIRLCTDLRLGNSISETFDWGKCKRVSKEEMPVDDWLGFDQVITGMNSTRRRINRFFRKNKGFQSIFPQSGEKIICLKNDFKGEPRLINGVMALAVSDARLSEHSSDLICDVLYEGSVAGLALYQVPFRQHYQEDVFDLPWMDREGLKEFDFGYAITVHKAQGSEWGRVLIADDGFKGNEDFRRRWMYTAVSRAKDELVWVQ